MRFAEEKIESFCGDVLPLSLAGDGNLSGAPVRWTAEGGAVRLRTFEAEADHPFSDGALVTLVHPGTAEITAELGTEICRCRITVREKQDFSGRPLRFFVGDFHDHTTTEHNHDRFAVRESGFPADMIRQIRKEGRLDFHVISDHASTLNPRDFFRGFCDARAAAEGDPIVFAGSESEVEAVETDRFGIPHKNSGEIVTVNADSFAGVHSWEEFYAAMAHSPHAACVLAHPQIIGYSVPGVWNFSLHKNNTPSLLRLVKAVEMGNGTDRESNLINEYTYSVALDNGFRLSTTCSSDCHGPRWGADVFPGKTVILAPERSREAFLDALEHRRFYASESGNVQLSCSVNGQSAPCDLKEAREYEFRVSLGYFQPDPSSEIVKCQLISDGGRTLRTLEHPGREFTFTVQSDSARYFYLRLTDGEGRKTWSPPVWTGREIAAPMTEPIPLDPSGFTAFEEKTGRDASVLLCGDPRRSWQAEAPETAVVIDMGKTQTVCALGHYPPHLTRTQLKEEGAFAPAKLAEFVHAYAISVSSDGVRYERCAEGIIRVYGGEEILSFPSCTARYIRFEVLSTAGRASERKQYADARPCIGELTVFTQK